MKKNLILILTAAVMLLACTALFSSTPVCAQTTASDPWAVKSQMPLQYASQFQVDFLENGAALVTIQESGRFLVLDEEQEAPSAADMDTEGLTVIRQPVQNIYLAATSAMCLFDALDGLDHVTMSGLKAEGWYIENARKAMKKGDIVFAGKYSAPDYEMILTRQCGLAIESTMISHAPEVKEKLLDLGIPVLVERSSYEPHPLGRTEWIKLYGLLIGETELAEKVFAKLTAFLGDKDLPDSGKKVAFFYISSGGNVVVRKSSDYVVKMIELSGGHYAFDGEDDGKKTGSLNLEMERFYQEAKDADIIIYNSAIDGEVASIDELLAKSSLLKDFTAVKSGNVWCTNKNLFQESTGFGRLIEDMHRVFTEEPDLVKDLHYLYRLK